MSDAEREEGERFLPDFDKRGGLLPVVVQSVVDGRVLMLGYADREAVRISAATGRATFWSTSRGKRWTKGETSGDYLRIEEILVDCDQDALLYRVTPEGGGVCHTRAPATGAARTSCFYRRLDPDTDALRPV
jgi:phosphoribosyl-AMP cyclohydrolase